MGRSSLHAYCMRNRRANESENNMERNRVISNAHCSFSWRLSNGALPFNFQLQKFNLCSQNVEMRLTSLVCFFFKIHLCSFSLAAILLFLIQNSCRNYMKYCKFSSFPNLQLLFCQYCQLLNAVHGSYLCVLGDFAFSNFIMDLILPITHYI